MCCGGRRGKPVKHLGWIPRRVRYLRDLRRSAQHQEGFGWHGSRWFNSFLREEREREREKCFTETEREREREHSVSQRTETARTRTMMVQIKKRDEEKSGFENRKRSY